MTTQLTAINWAKAVTIALIFVLISFFGTDGQRQILYACMHISYCLWWLIEQKIYPDRCRQIFTEKVDFSGFLGALLIVGVFYTLPAFFAFTNPAKLSVLATTIAIPLFYFGSLINTAADIQKIIQDLYGGSGKASTSTSAAEDRRCSSCVSTRSSARGCGSTSSALPTRGSPRR